MTTLDDMLQLATALAKANGTNSALRIENNHLAAVSRRLVCEKHFLDEENNRLQARLALADRVISELLTN